MKSRARAWLRKRYPAIAGIRGLVQARAQRRLIEVDYAYSPKARALADSAGGMAIRGLLQVQHGTFLELIHAFAAFRADFERIPVEGTPDRNEPFWSNTWMPSLDAASLYGLLATREPPVYLEIGSGNSTKFARRAISDHGLKTRVVSIDPSPRAEIDQISDDVIRAPFEDGASEHVAKLPPGSLLFFDGTHRSFQNSDATVFFTEVLPALPPGCVWGVHDIFLPYDYPPDWAGRFYNEQYLLMTYLLGGGGADVILLANKYASSEPALNKAAKAALFSGLEGIEPQGGCFWMERVRRQPSSA